MLWTAVGVVRGVYEKNCSMSCGTAGHQTLPAARRSKSGRSGGQLHCTAALAASQKRVDSLKIGRGYEASPRATRTSTWTPRLPWRLSARPTSFIPWWRRTRRAYCDCALSLTTRRMCSDADKFLLKVTPRTFSVVSRLTSGSSGGDWTPWRRRLSWKYDFPRLEFV